MVTSDRGDVVALTDAAGAPFGAYRYDAWGNPQGTGNLGTGVWSQGTSVIDSTLAAAITSRQHLRYAGYCYDAESELYYLSARMYDPMTRQFVSKDPAKADGEQSAYQYCGGDPVGRVDPTGTHDRSWWHRHLGPKHLWWAAGYWVYYRSPWRLWEERLSAYDHLGKRYSYTRTHWRMQVGYNKLYFTVGSVLGSLVSEGYLLKVVAAVATAAGFGYEYWGGSVYVDGNSNSTWRYFNVYYRTDTGPPTY